MQAQNDDIVADSEDEDSSFPPLISTLPKSSSFTSFSIGIHDVPSVHNGEGTGMGASQRQYTEVNLC